MSLALVPSTSPEREECRHDVGRTAGHANRGHDSPTPPQREKNAGVTLGGLRETPIAGTTVPNFPRKRRQAGVTLGGLKTTAIAGTTVHELIQEKSMFDTS